MPDDYIMRTADFLKVTMDPPVIVPAFAEPGPLTGSSTNTKVIGQYICLLGDEIPIPWREPQAYTSPPFVTPGMGLLQVILLPPNKTALTTNGLQILLRGGVFPAKFQVQSPAMQPTPSGPVPDPVLVKPGIAQFITSNATVKAG